MNKNVKIASFKIIDVTEVFSELPFDTFWVRPINSRLSWEDVSLYTRQFNKAVAKAAFEGGLHGRELSTTSQA